MRITTRLRIVSTVTIAALVILAPILIFSFIEFRSAKNDEALADAIKISFFERASFRDQYFLYREDRARAQWDNNKATSDRLIRQAEGQFRNTADRQALERLRRNIEDSADIFHRIVNNTAVMKAATGNRHVYEELDKRLSSQLLLKAEAIHDITTAMQYAGEQRVEQTYKYLTITVGLFALTLALATILLSAQIDRLIRKRLPLLHDGAEIIADGNLDYRIQCDGADEFSELAQSINAMTDKLQTFTRQLEAEIGAHRQAEIALRDQRDFAEGLVNTAQTIVLLLDTQGRIIRINPYMEEISGYTLAEVQGKDWFSMFLPKSNQAQTKAMFLEAINHVQTHGNVDAIVTRDGQERLIEWYDKTLKDAEGQTIGLLAIGQDITERKKAEADLKQLNEQLEQKIAEETAKNREKDHLLIQQSRLAAMGEMIHNIAHQWRQPINALTLLLANIQDAYEFNELTREYLNHEVTTGQRLIQGMSATIDDFRNFFMPNKEKEFFLAGDSVDEAVKLVKDSFAAHGINIVHGKSLEPCIILGYPNEFAQVVLNALTNAKEAIAGKNISGEIQVKSAKVENAVIVFIRDNGGGISDKVLGKVFDPYFTTKDGGSGIGLYMSKMIMDNMGGEIAIRNIEGGAEILLTLPLAASSVV